VFSFFALSWKTPQILEQAQLDQPQQEYECKKLQQEHERDKLQQEYKRDLCSLLHALPPPFQDVIQHCLQALPSIMALPMVLAHKDLGDLNMLVHPNTCRLLGVVDWAEAKMEPFGVNFYAVENLMGKFHFLDGFSRYPNYDTLYGTFWQTLKAEISPDLGDADIRAIRSAMLLGFLLDRGFTSRLANMPEPVPISDGYEGCAYNMLHLKSLLSQPKTRFPFLAEFL
jgi:hypothetical protein